MIAVDQKVLDAFSKDYSIQSNIGATIDINCNTLIDFKDDAVEAKKQLAENRKNLDNDAWATVIVDYYLGTKSHDEVFAAAKVGLTHPKEYAERLCEAYFYLAKQAASNGQYQQAANFYRLTLATNIYDFVEHRYARIELAKVKQVIEQSTP